MDLEHGHCVQTARSGFTLIELLVVFFIIAIAGFVGAAMLPGKQPAGVKAVAGELTGVLNSAQALAKHADRKVFLSTTGGGGTRAQLQWGFQDDGTVQGTWVQDNKAFAWTSVGVGDADLNAVSVNPDPRSAVPAMTKFISPGGWTSVFFSGGSTPIVSYHFDPSGAATGDFFITISGRSGGTVQSNGTPVAVILVGATSGVHAFYKPDGPNPGIPWQRL